MKTHQKKRILEMARRYIELQVYSGRRELSDVEDRERISLGKRLSFLGVSLVRENVC